MHLDKGGHLDEMTKTEFYCHSTCGTIRPKMYRSSKEMETLGLSLFWPASVIPFNKLYPSEEIHSNTFRTVTIYMTPGSWNLQFWLPFLGHHYHLLRLSDLWPGEFEEKKIFTEMHFHYMTCMAMPLLVPVVMKLKILVDFPWVIITIIYLVFLIDARE